MRDTLFRNVSHRSPHFFSAQKPESDTRKISPHSLAPVRLAAGAFCRAAVDKSYKNITRKANK